MDEAPGFLPNLTKSFKGLDAEERVLTADFAAACQAILPIFDHLGTVFSFAKSELNEKRESLVRVQRQLQTLDEVVDADAKAGRIGVKNSCARNLYRLLAGISFISQLLQNLANDRGKTLRTAATEAYDKTLAGMHSYMVRVAIHGAMYMLPSRENFLQSIGETEGTAKEHANDFAPACQVLMDRVLKLYVGRTIPQSETKWIST